MAQITLSLICHVGLVDFLRSCWLAVSIWIGPNIKASDQVAEPSQIGFNQTASS